ncbi:MAG: gamma-glutamyl-gamma-aminobutyrate hydrolase family protein [Acidobacteriota bacterium]|jgi:putative glutamine amidotransferase
MTTRSDSSLAPRPVVAISGCRTEIGTALFDVVRSRLVTAVVRAAGALPLVVPPLGGELDEESLLRAVDGVLLSGSESNIEPRRYGQDPEADARRDPARDATTIPLIRPVLRAGVPLLAICRGLQELNVAFGGTLHQAVHQVEGLADHREDESRPRDVQYAPRHPVHLKPGGILARIWGAEDAVVNSLHGQGIRRLGEGLVVEATAPDGLIEAVSVRRSRSFALGVQWHPEWFATEDPLSLRLFRAFGEACRTRARRRHPVTERDSLRSTG